MILDATAGYRIMWVKKDDPETVFLDQKPNVAPNVVALWQFLPFQDEAFDLVLFDPPHDRPGPNGIFRKKFGALNLDTFHIDFYQAFKELFRVLKKDHFLILKWASTRKSLSSVLALAPCRPLFWNTFGNCQETQTFWVCFQKRNP